MQGLLRDHLKNIERRRLLVPDLFHQIVHAVDSGICRNIPDDGAGGLNNYNVMALGLQPEAAGGQLMLFEQILQYDNVSFVLLDR